MPGTFDTFDPAFDPTEGGPKVPDTFDPFDPFFDGFRVLKDCPEEKLSP